MLILVNTKQFYYHTDFPDILFNIPLDGYTHPISLTFTF